MILYVSKCANLLVNQVCRQLVCPLLAVSRVLQRQVEDLAALLARKDAEIQDYQENGAVLSRGSNRIRGFDAYSLMSVFSLLTLI